MSYRFPIPNHLILFRTRGGRRERGLTARRPIVLVVTIRVIAAATAPVHLSRADVPCMLAWLLACSSCDITFLFVLRVSPHFNFLLPFFFFFFFAPQGKNGREAPVFVYEFTPPTEIVGLPACAGLACHTSELPYVFNNVSWVSTFFSVFFSR